MNKKALEWLYRELPGLVEAGVMPAEIADRLRSHYGELEPPGGAAKRAVILFSILGAALIGGGIILLLAHNWEELSRTVRALVSVLPLAISQLFGAWILFTKRQSVAWREGVGAFQALAIGAAISLVAQTYNLGGSFADFILTWSLLGLPIAYLLGATLPALFYLVGIAVWTGSVEEANRLWYFALLGLALPFLLQVSQSDRYHPRPVLLGWVLAITSCIGMGIALERVYSPSEAWPLVFAAMFAGLFLVGTRWWNQAASAWQRPFQTIGSLGAVGLSLLLTFHEPWGHRANWRHWGDETTKMELGCAIALFLASLILWVSAWKRRNWPEILLGSLPLVALAAWYFASDNAEFMGRVLFNLYLVILGIGTLVAGLAKGRLGVVNAGLSVLSAVILCRFFDSNLGFVLRGVAFILVGIGFLATNLVLIRRKGEPQA
jgi:uncharacterized membrane protein